MVNATVRSTLSERYEGRINYPFTAIVGQEKMKLALLLNAINPQIGGVLIRGERGSGKTIAVRGLSDILPEIEVAAGCRFSCDPSDISKMCVLCREEYEKAGKLPVQKRKMRVVELPIGTTEDRVVGTLNIERAIKEGVKALEIGMLAEARIANKLSFIDKNELIRLKNVIVGAGLPTKIPNLELERLVQAMKHDKKILQGKIRFILPKSIGEVSITDEVSPALIEQALIEQNDET